MPLFGGIEAGGTKFVCAVGSGPDDIIAEDRFPTEEPQMTLTRAIGFFRPYSSSLAGIGVAAFGPVDPDPESDAFGTITTTPKPGWANTPVVEKLRSVFDCPIGFDTDVNGAALGEYTWGAAQGLESFVYLTIGTGIGGGGMVGGELMHGLMHPEMGHMLIPHDRDRDPFDGVCPYHGDCWEGLANGPAIEKRWNQRGETLSADHPAWELEAHYLALGLVNVITILSPQRIIMGGGVMAQPSIFPLLHREVQSILNGYIQMPALAGEIDQYIVPPVLGSQAGVLGAFALAERGI